MADTNNHILTDSLGKSLTSRNWNIGLKEISHRAWEDKPPNTHIRGKEPIDGIWAPSTLALDIVGFKILGLYSSIGDYQGMVFDVTSQYILGNHENRVIRASSEAST